MPKPSAPDQASHDSVLGLKRAELSPHVRSYADNLIAQIQAILSAHNITSIEEFEQLAKDEKGAFSLEDIEKFQELVNLLKHAVENNEIYNLFEAREIMGEEDFIGPAQLKEIFGIEPENIPPLPFSVQDLQRAKTRGEFLILRMNALSNGKELTVANLIDFFGENFILLPVEDSSGEEIGGHRMAFYENTPNISWSLVGKIPIPDSVGNYFIQTRSIIKYIENIVFKDTAIPEAYQYAIDEFNEYVANNFFGLTDLEITEKILDDSDNSIYDVKWMEYAEKFSSLSINKLCRQSVVEVFFDVATYFKHTGRNIIRDFFVSTKSLDYDNSLLSLSTCLDKPLTFEVRCDSPGEYQYDVGYEGDGCVIFSREF